MMYKTFLNALPKDIQRYIWKIVYSIVMKDFYKSVKYIRSSLNLSLRRQWHLLTEPTHYKFFRFTNEDWGLVLNAGQPVSNIYSILSCS